MFCNLFDSHTHSDNSMDGHHSVTFMCEQAMEAGLSGFCVTDHCELRDYEKDHYEQRIAQSVFSVSKAKAAFRGRIALTSGVELSDVLYDLPAANHVLEAFRFDMVLASQHNAPDGVDAYYKDFSEWSEKELDEYLTWYFTYLGRLAKWEGYDVLAHITYPIRYITGEHKIPVDLRRYDDLIDEALRSAVEGGHAIEINTSGLRQPLGETMPPPRYVKRYRELGGEYITLGSDGHTADTVGAGIREGMRMLLDAGFSHFTFYKERQPLQFKIL